MNEAIQHAGEKQFVQKERMEILRAGNLRKDYTLGRASLPVLKDVCLSVYAGEVVAIVGASGAGKSTLLHILGALDAPTGGQVFFRGQDVYALSSRRRTVLRAQSIGFVFQFYHLFPELDVLENVMLPGLSAFSRVSGDLRARAGKLLESVGLAQRKNHRPMELSGGEQQRAALARALINNPELVLADEPTGNLDSVTGAQVLDMLFGLTRNAGHTLVLVTHNQDLARRCDRVLRLADGCMLSS